MDFQGLTSSKHRSTKTEYFPFHKQVRVYQRFVNTEYVVSFMDTCYAFLMYVCVGIFHLCFICLLNFYFSDFSANASKWSQGYCCSSFLNCLEYPRLITDMWDQIPLRFWSNLLLLCSLEQSR